MQITASNVLSSPEEVSTSLRWIAILSERSGCNLCASTGIHDGSAIVKQLLAGADAVQAASALYKHGFDHIPLMLNQLEDWMEAHDYQDIAAFRGKMAQSRSKNPAAYERVQFMKYFRDRE